MASLAVLKIWVFKVQKQGMFLRKFSPYEISKSGDKISNFWAFKIGFKVVILQYILNLLTKINHSSHYKKQISSPKCWESENLKF